MDFPRMQDYYARLGETNETRPGMSNSCGGDIDLDPCVSIERSEASGRVMRFLVTAAGLALLLLSSGISVEAASFRQGASAFMREDYVRASRILIPLAERGDPAAQAYLGFMFETGRGVPQNYTEAAMWYRRSAEQGFAAAQYSLGLLYDKGFGVPRNVVEANKWLNLSTAISSPRDRERRARIRDAVTTKMSRDEIAVSRLRALEWVPVRER
jgi:uncharacterized protein